MPLRPLQPADIDRVLGGGGVSPAITSQLAVWNRNLRARAFRLSVRRAVLFGRRSGSFGGRFDGGASSMERGGAGSATDEVQARIDELRHASIVTVEQICSRFIIRQDDGRCIDVTLRDAVDPQRNGSFGSDVLTVLGGGANATPTIYLKLAAATQGGQGGRGGGGGPPDVARQGSGYRALHKRIERLKPALATELDRFLGEGAVRDRMLLVQVTAFVGLARLD